MDFILWNHGKWLLSGAKKVKSINLGQTVNANRLSAQQQINDAHVLNDAFRFQLFPPEMFDSFSHFYTVYGRFG